MYLTLADALTAGCDSSSPAGKMGETGGASAGESLEREEESFVQQQKPA